MTAPVVFGHLGPLEHGVRRHGHTLARAVGDITPVVEVDAAEPEELLARLVRAIGPVGSGVIHLQYSDHLLAGSAFDAGWFTELRHRLPAATIVVTMHDLPYVGHDDEATDRRRSTCYRAVADLVDVAIVAFDHEQQGLALTGHRRPAVVIPHLVEPLPATGSRGRNGSRSTVGVLGYVYPGKGHADVLDACRPLGSSVRVDVLGRPSAGHERMLDDLRRRADECRVEISVAGWIPDDELGGRLAMVTVPVAPHPAPSASASVATWWSARRRPIVPDSHHARHLLGLHPDGVVIAESGSIGALTDAIVWAIAHPTSTLLADIPAALSAAAIGRRHVAAYQEHVLA